MSKNHGIPANVEQAFSAFNQGNPEPLIGAYGSAAVLIGTDEADWKEGAAAIAPALRADCGQVRADWNLRALALGPDAMVLVGHLNAVLPDGTVFPLRATYALSREGDAWRIAHSHLSAPRSE